MIASAPAAETMSGVIRVRANRFASRHESGW